MTDRPTALITGASAGIGEVFAEAYAERGHDLILTARRADRLEALADRLAAAHGIAATVLAADLADAAAPETLWREIEARGLRVDVLVNNAGYGLDAPFTEHDWAAHRDFIQVMMTACMHLAWLAIPPMRQRGYGRIVNVASLAAFMPGTYGHSLYGASKAFLLKASQSLSIETEGTGIHVTALCPGFTWSEFHDANGTRAQMDAIPKWMWMEARPVVEAAIAAVEKGEPVVVPGRVNRTLAWLARHLPQKTVYNLSRNRSDRQQSAP